MHIALLSLVISLSGASVAQATPLPPQLSVTASPAGGAVLGERTRVAGVLRQGGVPFAGQVVTLLARPHPFDGGLQAVGTTTTGADGAFRFDEALARNHDVRVSAPVVGASSRTRRVYVFPRATLRAETIRRNVVRLTQTLRVPSGVRLGAPTRFYLGRARAATATFAAAARPRRVRAGVYRAQASIRVPVSFDGRFSYAACFRATPGAGLGDPKARCPKARFRFP